MPALVLSVRFADRFHGKEWSPSPARLFQALCAGAAGLDGWSLSDEDTAALKWLEGLAPPRIAAPEAMPGATCLMYVPNNDGDRRDTSSKIDKRVKPLLFDQRVPLLYVWRYDGDDGEAPQVCRLAECMFRLGWGVDMAWCAADRLSDAAADVLLRSHPGITYRPDKGSGQRLAVPQRDSLVSWLKYKWHVRIDGKTHIACWMVD
jgi:CRISPR-associated protein Csb2